MKLTKLMTTAAAAALAASTAFASDNYTDGATLDRQNPNPSVPSENNTTVDFDQIDTAAELQAPETLDRQNPQAVDPVNINFADMSDEAAETYRAVLAAEGADIVLEDGTVLGAMTDMDVDNLGKGEITIDVSDSTDVPGDVLVITTGPENINVDGDSIIIASNADEIGVLAGGDQGADDGQARVYLN